MGMSKKDAELSADVLIYADIRGIESHGVSNMLRRYVDAFAEKDINPTPKPKVSILNYRPRLYASLRTENTRKLTENIPKLSPK